MNNEERLKARIRSEFCEDRTMSAAEMEQVEREVLGLMQQYCRAPQHEKENVYAKAEKRILDLIRSADQESHEFSSTSGSSR